MTWHDAFREGAPLFLSTVSEDSGPHANIVTSLGVTDDGKLLIGDCRMQTTLQNLRGNPSCCLVSGTVRIKGTVENIGPNPSDLHCKAKGQRYPVRNAIIVRVREAFDLDTGKAVA